MNPYQQLLNRGLAEADIVSTPVVAISSFEVLLNLAGQTRGVGMHLHWLNSVLGGSTDAADADRRADAFLERLRAFRERGGRLIWTVHNVVPHDAVYMKTERRLQQGVADLCDIVHVMDAATTGVLRGDLWLDPTRVAVVPHPGYQGAYPDTTTREAARAALGLHEDEVVYAMLGAIKPYKGIEEVLDGFDSLLRQDPRPRRLVVAGPAEGTPWARHLVARLRRHPRVLLQDTAVPNDRMQFLLRAADVVVLGHRRALNSGGAMLAPTFGVPVLAARTGVLPHVLHESFAEFFDPATASGVHVGLAAADRLLTSAARASATAFANRHHPDMVAARFAQEVAGRLWS